MQSKRKENKSKSVKRRRLRAVEEEEVTARKLDLAQRLESPASQGCTQDADEFMSVLYYARYDRGVASTTPEG